MAQQAPAVGVLTTRQVLAAGWQCSSLRCTAPFSISAFPPTGHCQVAGGLISLGLGFLKMLGNVDLWQFTTSDNQFKVLFSIF